ncbi:MaoC/PaaZ C-terminal domain-containing protein [Alteromonas sp. ASW11-19]|uniref:MaoC/PaaZ C-terminal domain-containing protein n=1 Tax=Alteromonas salexigens TaxID=2982530 RepID=A0ABT2VR50_9ALTE|nr:MaoC/PaaZ C-terminal domain-containing protein [Alteromonas salexigens]MCU7555802.1 MaoC/PaaZ C-terminal domain-containing protein [Alteromonas salexigens]
MSRLLDLQINDTVIQNSWHKVTQQSIDQFAEATGDYQWIHTNPARCEKESPFKAPIAHGFLTASLMPDAFSSILTEDARITSLINYGIDNLRFLEPVVVNSEVQYQFTVAEVTDKPSGRLFRIRASCAIKGRDKPALVGEFLLLAVIEGLAR